VYGDGLEELSCLPQGHQLRLALLKCLKTHALGLLHGAICGSGLQLVRAQTVADAIEHVAHQQRLEQGNEEGGAKLEPFCIVAGSLIEAPLLLEKHNAKAVETCVAQGLAKLRDVHAEATGTAGASGEKHILLDNLLGGHALLVAQV